MNAEQQAAFEWAKNQKFRSVAAQYAKTLADLIESLQAQLTASQRRERAAVDTIPFGRFYEIMQAERDGRLVVLPCKCGECEKYKSVSPKCGNCNRTTVIQHPEDYCNHGIRRENNEN